MLSFLLSGLFGLYKNIFLNQCLYEPQISKFNMKLYTMNLHFFLSCFIYAFSPRGTGSSLFGKPTEPVITWCCTVVKQRLIPLATYVCLLIRLKINSWYNLFLCRAPYFVFSSSILHMNYHFNLTNMHQQLSFKNSRLSQVCKSGRAGQVDRALFS